MSILSVSEKLKIDKDGGSIPTYGINWAHDGVAFELQAGVELILPITKPYRKALFNFAVGTNVWVKPDDGTPVQVPTAVPTLTTADLNPTLRIIENDTGLRFICDTTSYVKVSFYFQ